MQLRYFAIITVLSLSPVCTAQDAPQLADQPVFIARFNGWTQEGFATYLRELNHDLEVGSKVVESIEKSAAMSPVTIVESPASGILVNMAPISGRLHVQRSVKRCRQPGGQLRTPLLTAVVDFERLMAYLQDDPTGLTSITEYCCHLMQDLIQEYGSFEIDEEKTATSISTDVSAIHKLQHARRPESRAHSRGSVL